MPSVGLVTEGGYLFSARKVVRARNLDVGRFAFDHADIATCPLNDRGGVGPDEPLTGGAVVRFEEPGRLEDLRRLHRPELGRVAGNPTILGEDRRWGHGEPGDAADRLFQSGQ